MKKVLFLMGIFSVLFLASCNMPTNNTVKDSTNSITTTQNSRLKQFLMEWMNNNPNWENNQVIQEETDAKFMAAFIDTMRHYNMLEELPFTLEEVGTHKSKYVVLLKHDAYKAGMLNPRIWCGVIGYVSKEDVAKLVEGKDYRFTGKFKSLIFDRSDYFPYSTKVGDLNIGKHGDVMHLATSIIDIDSIWCVDKNR